MNPRRAARGAFDRRAPPGALRFVCILAVALVTGAGCDASSASPGGDGGVPLDLSLPADLDIPGAMPDATGDGAPQVMGPGFTGTLVDEAGVPLGGEMVLACMQSTCYVGTTAADGWFHFEIKPVAEIACKTAEKRVGIGRRAAALYPVRIADSVLVELGRVHVPSLPDGVPLGPEASDPQTLAAGDGLELTLRRADLAPALGDTLSRVAARAIPRDRFPLVDGVSAAQVVAVYALHPFAASSRSPISVRAPSDLPAGTPVTFRTLSELDGRASTPVSGHSDGAFVTTDSGKGITELSWLVIAK